MVFFIVTSIKSDEYKDIISFYIYWLCFSGWSHAEVIAGLAALGSIVRWGSEGDIEVSLNDVQLFYLDVQSYYFVKNACWIISNLGARK